MLLIQDLSIRVAGRLLLDHANAQIPEGSRVGLVGRNGIGKSTLFRAIVNEIGTESGSISLPKQARIGRLAQEAPGGPESLIEVVLAAATERADLLAAAEHAHDPTEIADIQTRLSDIAAHSAPARAASILAGLGFSETDQARPCHEFSGGWRMRVALAAALFAEPDVLLLDEPTNYLDLEGTLWLEAHLARYPHTAIVISHDRDLLDSAVEFILHLDAGKLTFYRGTYSSFDRQRREQQALNAKHAKKQEAERAHLQKFVDRFRATASKARQAQSRVKALAKLQPITGLVSQEVRPIKFPAPERLPSPPILAVDNATLAYDNGPPVLQRLTFRLDPEDRIALLGSNGNGKSTLAKLIAGKLEPRGGRVTRGDRLKVSYFAQHQLDELDPADSAYQHLRTLLPNETEAKVRARAGAIGFSGDMANTPSEKLSGGEKARLLLGLATMNAPHLIILDEPTNHLDIDSRGALIEAINDFPGAVILISHDRHLLEACADQLWLVDKGTVTTYDGDLDDYRKLVLSSRGASRPGVELTASDATPEEKVTRADARRAAAERRLELAPLRREIVVAEKEIARLTTEIVKLDATLATPGLSAGDPGKIAELGKARTTITQALGKIEAKWLELSERYEQGAPRAKNYAP